MKRWQGITLCAALLAAACTQDTPTETGSGLLPPDAVRTFEVVLGPEMWLQWDTAFNIYSQPADADFLIIANTYDDVVSSRALLRYTLPRTISLPDTAGVLRTDSMPQWFEGELRLIADSLASTDRPITLEAFHTTEPWDRTSATWTLRVDTGGVQLPWSQPGGSPGALIGSFAWANAADTIAIPIDSATMQVWADTLNTARGAVVTSATPDSRLRTALPTLRARARSSWNPDTVIEVTLAPNRTFIYTPQTPVAVGAPRVGGVPAYRTILRLRDRMDTVTIACPGVPDCSVRLRDAAINYAAVLLQPVPAPPGFVPESPVQVTMHILLPSPLVPLQRSAVSGSVLFEPRSVPVSSFLAPGAPVVELPSTEFFRAAFDGENEEEQPTSHVALLGATRTFGFGTFESLPSLRLIISVARELQLP